MMTENCSKLKREHPWCGEKELLKLAIAKNEKRIRYGGYIADRRTARKPHRADCCHGLILAGEKYYAVTKGGGGISWLRSPDRCHKGHLFEFLVKLKEDHR